MCTATIHQYIIQIKSKITNWIHFILITKSQIDGHFNNDFIIFQLKFNTESDLKYDGDQKQ